MREIVPRDLLCELIFSRCFSLFRYERVGVQPDEWAAAPVAPPLHASGGAFMAAHHSNPHVALPIGGNEIPPVAMPQPLPSQQQHPPPHAPALPLGHTLVADAYDYEVRPGVVWQSARAIFSAHWTAYMALLLFGLLAAALVAGALGIALLWAANANVNDWNAHGRGAGGLGPHRPASSHGDSSADANADAAATMALSGDERVWLLIGGSLVIRLVAQWVFHVARCAALLVSLEHMRGRRQVLEGFSFL